MCHHHARRFPRHRTHQAGEFCAAQDRSGLRHHGIQHGHVGAQGLCPHGTLQTVLRRERGWKEHLQPLLGAHRIAKGCAHGGDVLHELRHVGGLLEIHIPDHALHRSGHLGDQDLDPSFGKVVCMGEVLMLHQLGERFRHSRHVSIFPERGVQVEPSAQDVELHAEE
eukprot:scaffold25_cov342-Pavlova_lutheri.AAC.46